MIEFQIHPDSAGVRLDKLLRKRLPTVPVSHLFKMVRTKKVRVNGKRATPDQPLTAGDVVSIRGDEQKLVGTTRPSTASTAARLVSRGADRLDVLLEDDWMMAVNKPSGMAVHPGSGIEAGTLVDLVRAYLGPKAVRNDFTASPAHRLDRETSGVILVAKRRPAMVHFTHIFTEGHPKKCYLTLVKGRMPKASGTIEIPLAERQQTAASKAVRGVNMQEAITRYRVLEQASDCSLLECVIETGRTHQIRRHLAAVGHPVAGDKKYGDFAFNRDLRARLGLRRLFLHARSIEFPHPEHGRKVRVEAGLPKDLLAVVNQAGLKEP